MGKRSEWTFSYTIDELRPAATARLAYHVGRLAHWTEKMQAAEADLKENGIDFREVAKRNTLSNSGYRQQPTFDPIKLAAMEEAQGKVDHHERLVGEYKRFLRAFEHEQARGLTASRALDLVPDDLEYFGL